MTVSTAAISIDLLYDLASDAGVDPRAHYSGRGMYGEQCIGIVTNTAGLIRFTQAVQAAVNLVGAGSGIDTEDAYYTDVRTLATVLEDVRSDDMGLNTIYYWPGVQVRG